MRVFIRSLGMRTEAADDVAQEAFVVAFEKLQTFERGTNFGAWLRTIARFLVSKELRREDRRRRLLAEHVAEFLVEEELPAAEGDPAQALKRCFAELPERGRRLVQQRYFDNISPAALASQEWRTVNEVRQALVWLRAVLHRCVTLRIAGQHS